MDFSGVTLTCVAPRVLGNLETQQTSNVANPAHATTSAATAAAANVAATASITVTIPVAYNS